MQKVAASVRRKSPAWLSGSSTAVCDDCCCGVCGEPFAHDPMLMPMTGGWYGEGESMTQGCGCGESEFPAQTLYYPGNDACCGQALDASTSNFVPQNPVPNQPQSFPPVPQKPNSQPTSPSGRQHHPGPAPHDVTPMDIPKHTPENFDPLLEEGVPAPGELIDPVGFEIPRLPPISDRRSRANPVRGPHPAVHVPTTAGAFRR